MRENTSNRTILAIAASIGLASPALAQSLSPDLAGRWDVSNEACAASGTATTGIAIASDRIDTFGGNALVREVERQGAITFVAADFRQIEGVPELGPRTREYFRFAPIGPDRMTMIWKDVQTVDLVRCGRQATAVGNGTMGVGDAAAPATSARASAEDGSTEPTYDGQLPIALGLWVVAGEDCRSPANAAWRVYDGAGLRGASSLRCEIDTTQQHGDAIVFSQLCEARYDGQIRPTRDRITITASRRFTLVEGDEGAGQDFNWCGSRLQP